MEDDEEEEEARFEEELSHEKLAAPPGLEWTITPERKKNAKMVEVNTVTNEGRGLVDYCGFWSRGECGWPRSSR